MFGCRYWRNKLLNIKISATYKAQTAYTLIVMTSTSGWICSSQSAQLLLQQSRRSFIQRLQCNRIMYSACMVIDSKSVKQFPHHVRRRITEKVTVYEAKWKVAKSADRQTGTNLKVTLPVAEVAGAIQVTVTVDFKLELECVTPALYTTHTVQ